jgi:hypothetical protein
MSKKMFHIIHDMNINLSIFAREHNFVNGTTLTMVVVYCLIIVFIALRFFYICKWAKKYNRS